MLTTALDGLDVDPSRCVMVGDRIQTDIQMALDTGAHAGLVLTGEATASDANTLLDGGYSGYVLDRVDRLVPAWAWDELGWTTSDS
ncbi:HAD hydrolase-like protein [Xylanimonas allomyrinae]|uniref:HAD hydrolase-like protein n=1 Tax=Xylanimonas allomyrinae TaxID=2509459 RepID=UPI001B860516|nr:HAD hydrolase-like protein [Xylanimonas allomyrinae]